MVTNEISSEGKTAKADGGAKETVSETVAETAKIANTAGTGVEIGSGIGAEIGAADASATDPSVTELSVSGRARGRQQPLRLQSSKLNRTLEELESAFNQWESLGLENPDDADKTDAPAKTAASGKDGDTSTSEEAEFKKKTRKLLLELRRQLTEL